jgi:hypothetical protein
LGLVDQSPGVIDLDHETRALLYAPPVAELLWDDDYQRAGPPGLVCVDDSDRYFRFHYKHLLNIGIRCLVMNNVADFSMLPEVALIHA